MTLASSLNPAELFEEPDIGILTSTSLECQIFERKKQRDADKIAETISAFSNTNKNGGLIAIGINDDGSIEGLTYLGQEWINKFAKQLDAHLHDKVYEVKQFNVNNKLGINDVIILILVKYSADKLIEKSDGKAYRRIGDSTRELNDEQKLEFKFAKGQLSYEEKSFGDYTRDMLDEGVLNQFLEGIKKRDGLSLSLRPEQALQSKGLIKAEKNTQMLTSVGLLILGKTPSSQIFGAKIRFVKYDGQEEKSGEMLNIIKDEIFDGPLPILISKTFEFVKTQIKEFSYLDANGKFIKEPEYPYGVVLEAIVNAVAHRSYSLSNTPVFIKMFDNRLIVESPGRFPGTVTPENFFHCPRNPNIMECLKYFDYVKALSEGTRRMRFDMQNAHLPAPLFRELDDKVTVTLFNNMEDRKNKQNESSAVEVNQTANMFFVSVSNEKDEEYSPSFFDEGFITEIKKRFVSALIKNGWFIPDMGMSAFQQYNPLHIIDFKGKRILSVLPGFKFGIRNINDRLMLVIDPSIMIRSHLTLLEIESAGLPISQLLGINAYDKSEKISGRIVAVSEKAVLNNRKGNFTSLKYNLVPHIKTHQLQFILNKYGINYNLDQETKKYSYLTTVGAPKIRYARTLELSKLISEKIFPLNIDNFTIKLSQAPVKLSSPLFTYKNDLKDVDVSFDPQNKFISEIVLNGITKFGSYEKPSEQINIIPVCTSDVQRNMNNLLNQISKGSFRYQGSERTFGMSLNISTPIICNTPEDYHSTVDKFIIENKLSDNTLFFVYCPEKGYSRYDYKAPYYAVKKLLLEKGYASQMVDEETLQDTKFKDLNLGLDIFAKSGFTPWVLAEGFPNCDLFLGLSYSSIADITGQTRIIGYVNVFDKMGRWTFYEGSSEIFNFDDRKTHLKTLVGNVIASLQAQRNIKKIHIHHSSKLSEDIKESIYEDIRSKIPSAELTFVWINSDTPVRMYDSSYYSDGSIPRGSYVISSVNQFYISTTGFNNLNQKAMGTPQLLEINVDTYPERTDKDLKNIANQILALTKLNWASTKTFCHLPITLKFATDIAYLMNAIYKGFGQFKLNEKSKRKPWFL